MAINFPNAPTVGQTHPNPPVAGQPVYTWDGEKWGSGASTQATTIQPKKNYILNGAMQISQERGQAAGMSYGTGWWAVDQFVSYHNQTFTGAYTFGQIGSVTPGGSPTRVRLTVTTALTTLASNDLVWLSTRMEGLRVADLLFGSAAAKSTVVQFGVRAPAGTYSFAVINATANRGYVCEYTISAGEAMTNVVRSAVIPGDTTGTWRTDTGVGIEIRWPMTAGSGWRTPAGSWQPISGMAGTNQSNLFATNGNIFELFDVSMTEGTVAPKFQVPDSSAEHQACKRYWQQVRVCMAASNQAAAGLFGSSVMFPVEMRAAPTATVRINGCSNFTIGASDPFTYPTEMSLFGYSVAVGTVVIDYYFNMNARM